MLRRRPPIVPFGVADDQLRLRTGSSRSDLAVPRSAGLVTIRLGPYCAALAFRLWRQLSTDCVEEVGCADQQSVGPSATCTQIGSIFADRASCCDGMKLDGSILENLEGALASARRLRGHPVYKDTLRFWGEPLQEARRARHDSPPQQKAAINAAIAKLVVKLADRSVQSPAPSSPRQLGAKLCHCGVLERFPFSAIHSSSRGHPPSQWSPRAQSL